MKWLCYCFGCCCCRLHCGACCCDMHCRRACTACSCLGLLLLFDLYGVLRSSSGLCMWVSVWVGAVFHVMRLRFSRVLSISGSGIHFCHCKGSHFLRRHVPQSHRLFSTCGGRCAFWCQQFLWSLRPYYLAEFVRMWVVFMLCIVLSAHTPPLVIVNFQAVRVGNL